MRDVARVRIVPDMKHVLARHAFLDLEEGFLAIDGVSLPWWLARVPPRIEAVDGAYVELEVTFIIDGRVDLVVGGGRKTIDPVLGDVGEWARNYVREQMLEAYPDLQL